MPHVITDHRGTCRALSVALFVAGFAVTGCGGSDSSSDAAPKPGTMELISAMPASAAPDGETASLVYNGVFREFWAGAPAPSGFTIPESGGASNVVRGPGLKDKGASSFCAEQTWQSSDAGVAPDKRFATRIRGLRPGTLYRLEVFAEGTTGALANVGFADAGGNAEISGGVSVSVAGGLGPSRYLGWFTPAVEGEYILSASLQASDEFPAAVRWYEWKLTPEGDEVPRAALDAYIAERGPRDANVQEQLRQIEEQAKARGGYAAWTQEVTAFRNNLRETLNLVAAAKTNTFAGEDGYYFSRFSALHLLETDMCYGAGGACSEMVRSILDLDRRLKNRRIDLLVAPVPAPELIYADKLVPGTDPASHVAPQVVHFLQFLEAMNVEVLDFTPEMVAGRQQNEQVYFRTDDRCSSETIARLGKYMAGRLSRYGFLKVEGASQLDLQVQKKQQNWHGNRLKELQAEEQGKAAEESQAILQVTDSAGQAFSPPERSAILLAGAAAATYIEDGASLAAHLSRELRYPVAIAAQEDPGPAVPLQLLKLEPASLDGVRVVVWLFPMSYLRVSGAYTWEVLPEE